MPVCGPGRLIVGLTECWPTTTKYTAPATVMAAAADHATAGSDFPAAGRPAVAEASRSRTAVPMAVPSWAVVMMMPAAEPCQCA